MVLYWGFLVGRTTAKGAVRTRGELGTGQMLLGFLPNGWSKLIDSENGRHGIS